MLTIIRKSDIQPCGTIPNNMTVEQEILLNVLPNFGGSAEDYEVMEMEALPPSLSEIQQQKILELATKCEQEILEGFYSTARGIREWFTNSRDDQANVMAQASLATLNPTIIPQWKSASENICTDFTLEQIVQLATDGALFKTERMKTFEALKQQVMLCTVECVGGISWANYTW